MCYSIFFALLTSFIITYLAIPKVISFAQKYRLSDSPVERASHVSSVPIFGGVAIFSGLIFSLLVWAKVDEIQFIVVSLIIIFFFRNS